MKTVEVLCAGCSKKFGKRIADYNRTERRGGKHFCSLSCSISISNKTVKRGNVGHFHGRKGIERDGYSPFRWFVTRAVCRRKKKGDTNLTVEYLKELWENQKGVCPFTGWGMELPETSQGWKNCSGKTRRASLDRIDCSKGYVKGNVRFVCVIANMARQNYSDDDVIEFCKAVAVHSVV